MKVLSYMVEAHIFKEVEGGIEFLMIKRAEKEMYGGVWQMVTGSIHQDEKAYDTVMREILEETGLIPEKIWVVPFVNSFYSRRRNHICLVPVFAALVKNDSVVKLSEEHSDYRWVDKDSAIKLLAWQGQRQSVNTIYEYFMNERSFLNFEEISTSRLKQRMKSKHK